MFGGSDFWLKTSVIIQISTQETLTNFHGDEAKKLNFSKWPILKFVLGKFHGLVLGSVGLIDVKGNDVVLPIWP